MSVHSYLAETVQFSLSLTLDRRAISISSDLSSRSVDFTILKDIYNLHNLLLDTIQNNPDIEYIFVVDQNLEIIIHTFGQDFKVSEDLLKANVLEGNEWGDDTQQLEFLNSEVGVIHDVVSPILGGEAGFIRVGLNEKQIYRTIDDVTFTIILSTVFIGLLGFIIAFFLTKYMYRDLTHIMNISKQVGTGNLECHVEIDSKDEIGLLAREFNTMITRLKIKKEENNHYLKVLQMRNSELELLHQLAVGSADIKNFEKHLENATERLIDELDMNSCTIEIELSDEKITTFKRNQRCQICSDDYETECIRLNHFTIPIEANQKNIGYIKGCFENKADDTTLKFMTSFARQLSVIAENVQLWKEIKYKEQLRLKLLDRVITAQEEERKRIARELHDETSQSITSIIVGLSLLHEHEISKEMKQKIAEIKEVTQQTLDEIHYISWSLRPSVLDDLGLIPAIKKYGIEYMKKYEIDIDIQVIGLNRLRLSSLIEVTIYRVIQEALTNAARHAEADNISIILKYAKGIATVIIEDDGKGFDAKQILNADLTKDHLGLKGMQERIESIGGKLVIESNKGIGTTIYVQDIWIGEEDLSETENNDS
ncbi:histidine kinase [Bacillaceae bacterium IKA-2]|nr:histidine kinase [Bacillaceae bacterium IKA-2]